MASRTIPFEMSSPVGQQCTLVLQQNGFGIHEARLRAGGVEDEVAFEALIAAQ